MTGRSIARLLRETGWTQKQLAERLGVQEKTVCRYVNDRIDTELRGPLAAAVRLVETEARAQSLLLEKRYDSIVLVAREHLNTGGSLLALRPWLEHFKRCEHCMAHAQLAVLGLVAT